MVLKGKTQKFPHNTAWWLVSQIRMRYTAPGPDLGPRLLLTVALRGRPTATLRTFVRGAKPLSSGSISSRGFRLTHVCCFPPSDHPPDVALLQPARIATIHPFQHSKITPARDPRKQLTPARIDGRPASSTCAGSAATSSLQPHSRSTTLRDSVPPPTRFGIITRVATPSVPSLSRLSSHEQPWSMVFGLDGRTKAEVPRGIWSRSLVTVIGCDNRSLGLVAGTRGFANRQAGTSIPINHPAARAAA